MIDLDRGRIKLGEREEVIKAFVVYFMTPFGLATSYQEAKEIMAEKAPEVPLQHTISPLPVAIGETDGFYEVLLSNR